MIIRAALALLCLCTVAHAQPTTTNDLAKQFPGRQIIVDSDKTAIKSTGPGGTANGNDAKLDQANMKPPAFTPWGSGMGGSADSSLSAAASVYGSQAFRWLAGIVGLIALLVAFFIGKAGNLRGAAVFAGTGIGLLIGTIFFPEWLELGLLAFLCVHLWEYAYTHGLFTGTLASINTAIHNAGIGAAFNRAMDGIAEKPEAALVNKSALANGATSVKVSA